MKHMKPQKAPRQVSKLKMIIICCILAVVAFGGVIITLTIMRGNLGYSEALENVNEIWSTKDSVNDFLVTKSEKLDDSAKQRMDDFNATVEKNRNYLESLSASSALKNETINSKYQDAKKQFELLEQVAKAEQGLKKIIDSEEITDDLLKELGKLDNQYVTDLAKDLQQYQQAAKDFNTKFAEPKNVKDAEIQAAKQELDAQAKALNEKYATVEFEDMFEFSVGEVMHFYDSIEELRTILNEKI